MRVSNYQNLNEDFFLRISMRQGPGVLKELPEYIRKRSLKRPAVVVDQNVMALEPIQNLLLQLDTEGFNPLVFKYDLPFEPTYEALEEHRGKFVKNGHPIVDLFIGIGGGSSMDFAKGLATLATNPGPALQYRGFPTDLNPSLPNITVPTVAGSGAEITFNAVFIEEATKKKLGINTHYNYPLVAFVDLEVARRCPLSVTLSSGMDALVHTISGFASQKCGVLSRALFLEAFTLLFKAFPGVMKDPENLSLRSDMFTGSHLAAFGLQNAGSGPAGVIGDRLGNHYRISHGIAGGISLAHVVRCNVEKGYFGYADLYDRIEGADRSLSREQKAWRFVDQIFWLQNECGVPQDLKKFGLTPDRVPAFLTLFEESNFVQNPVPFLPGDVERIILKLL